MKEEKWRMFQVAIVAMSCLLGVPSLVGQVIEAPGALVRLISPPGDLTLASPSRLPLIAEVSGIETGHVLVEFFDGDQSLGVVDSPFNILPGLEPDAELDPSGIYSLNWENVPLGTLELSAALWVDGVLVDRSSSSRIVVMALDEQAEVNIRVVHPSAVEGGDGGAGSAVIELERTGLLEASLDVFFAWTGDATLGEDFRAPRDSVTFLPGESTALVDIQLIDDQLVEGDETLVLQLLPPVCVDVFPPLPSCYLVGPSHEGVVALRDNDSVAENEAPFVVLLEPLSAQTFREGASVSLRAHAWDLDGDLESVEFFAGNRSLGRSVVESVPSEIIDSNGVPLPPSPSVVLFTWEDVPVGRYTLTARAVDSNGAVSDSSGVAISVVGDELPSVVSIEASDGEAVESQSRVPGRPAAVDSGTFVIRRTGSLQRAMIVSLSIEGTASNGLDYSRIRNRVTIPAGHDSVSLQVTPLDDRIIEGTETVLLGVQPSDCGELTGRGNRCYVVGRAARARVIIEDDERTNQTFAPSVSLVRPSDGSVLKTTQEVTLIALADDRDGRVVSVAFFVNGDRVGEARARGNGRSLNRFFQLELGMLPPGRFDVIAVATDNDRKTSRSEPSSFMVEPDLIRPVISVTALDPIAAELAARDESDPNPDDSSGRARVNTATFLVTRTGLRDVAVSIPYRLSGRATNGDDYRALSGTLELAAGETSARLVIQPIDDREFEGPEDILLELLPIPCIAIFPPPETCYTLGRSKSARAVIRDNDAATNQPPRVAIVSPADGDEIVRPNQIAILVDAIDEDGIVEEIGFYSGNRLLGLGIVADNAVPGEMQRFEFNWFDPDPGRHLLTVIARDDQGRMVRSGSVVIVIRDLLKPRTLVAIEAVDSVATEGASDEQGGSDPGVFRFSRRGDLSVPVEVSYRIGGRATNGRDYVRIGRSFTFEPGEDTVELVIEPLDDERIEGTETVEIALLRPACIAIFPPPPECYELTEESTAVVRIEDNDRKRNLAPRVAIVQPRTRSVFHQPANVTVRVEALDRDGWIGYVALFSGDKMVAEQTLNFIREPDPGILQYFTLVWENASVGAHELTAEVRDDSGARSRSRVVEIAVRGQADIPVVTVAARDSFASEATENRPANQASFRIGRTGKTDEDLFLRYVVSGTAENGTDYEALSGEFVIPAKKRWATLDVIPLDDNEVERAETVIVSLVDAESVVGNRRYAVGRPARAGVVINNRASIRPGPQRLEDGTIHIGIPAPNGVTFRIEAGTKLGEWDVIGTNTVTEDAIHIVDTESEGTEFRFFRIVPDGDAESGEE